MVHLYQVFHSNKSKYLKTEMADKSFGVKEIDLIGVSGTPTITSPNNLNINATTTAIQNDVTIGGKIGLGGANYGSSGQVLTSNGTSSDPTWQTSSGGGGSLVKLGTVATNSGTEAAFTSIPSTAKKITVAIHKFGFSGSADDFIMQVGDSGGYATTGYQSSYDSTDAVNVGRTDAYGLTSGTNQGLEYNITVELVNVTGNSWTISHTGGSNTGLGSVIYGGGSISLSNALDKLKIKTVNGRTLDNGHITVYYETEGSSGSGSGGFVTGMIMMFSGTTAPTGWVLCDNSTAAQGANAPDLRDRFIVGTGNSYSLNDTGGSANAVLIAHSHVHNNDIVEEGNEFSIGPGSRSASSKNDSTEITGVDASGNASTTQTGTNANLPPYYALAFIMKT